MMKQPDYIKHLLKKYMQGDASPGEQQILMSAWDLYDDEELQTMVADLEPELTAEPPRPVTDWKPMAAQLSRRTKRRQDTILQWTWVTAWSAACIILAVVAILKWQESRPSAGMCYNLPGDADIPTGRYSCTLVLDSSQSLAIDSASQGRIRRYGNMEVVQQTPGVLTYRRVPFSSLADTASRQWHTVVTPVHQQYLVVLPDGTRLRLNAATAVRLPLGYTTSRRMIELLRGEIFVECKKAKEPLLVKTGNAAISVRSGKFNVNVAFGSTLVVVEAGEAVVKNSAGGRKELSACGIASVLRLQLPDKRLADTVMHWKNGNISALLAWKKVNRMYQDVPLRGFVGSLSLWYGLKFASLDCLPNVLINAEICYQAPVEEMIAIIEKNGVPVYRSGNQLSFCHPVTDQNTTVAQLGDSFRDRHQPSKPALWQRYEAQ